MLEGSIAGGGAGASAPLSVMFVRFVDGDWYTYFDVPENVCSAFVAAESHGRFFHPHILDRYRYLRGRR